MTELEKQLTRVLHQQELIIHHLQCLRPPVRHGWLKILFRDLGTNPHTQYKVHLYGAIYWLINFPLVTLLFFFAPALWLKLGIFITLVYSIYANLATDYGSMSAAEAAFGPPLPVIPLEAAQTEVPEPPAG